MGLIPLDMANQSNYYKITTFTLILVCSDCLSQTALLACENGVTPVADVHNRLQ